MTSNETFPDMTSMQKRAKSILHEGIPVLRSYGDNGDGRDRFVGYTAFMRVQGVEHTIHLKLAEGAPLEGDPRAIY